MKLKINRCDEELLLEMATVRGKDIKVENVPFSFYFSSKIGMKHAIRIKVCWNREKFKPSMTGYIELHGDYKYRQDVSSDYTPSEKEIEALRAFVKKYKVLFAAVWENILYQNDLIKFFEGDLDLKQVLDRFDDISDVAKRQLQKVDNLDDAEQVVREFNLFNMND